MAWTARARRHRLAGSLRQSPRGFLARGSAPCAGEGQSHRAGPAVSLCAQLRPEQRCAPAAILGGESGRPAGGARYAPRPPSACRVRGRRAVPCRACREASPPHSALLARLRSPCSRPSRRSRGSTPSTRRTSSCARMG